MIKTNNLKKVFYSNGNEINALRGVTINVEEGDIHGVIGMSGAGKSTLLRCLGMLEPVEAGEVIIDKQDVSFLDKRALREFRKQIGIIFQGYHLFEQKTIKSNVAFPLELSKKSKEETHSRVVELLELVGLSDKINAYPAELSGGQQQRVAIARALATNCKILLCDEPTSALDLLTIKSVLDLLKKINAELGVTIVIITHEMSVIKSICNHVTVLDDGLVAESGPTKEIFDNPKAEITKKLVVLEEELF